MLTSGLAYKKYIFFCRSLLTMRTLFFSKLVHQLHIIKVKSKNNKITKAILNKTPWYTQQRPHPLDDLIHLRLFHWNPATIIAFFLSKMPVFMRMSMNISTRLATVVSAINVNHFVTRRKRKSGGEWERHTHTALLPVVRLC